MLFPYRSKLDCKAINVKLGCLQFAPEWPHFRDVQKPHTSFKTVETVLALFFWNILHTVALFIDAVSVNFNDSHRNNNQIQLFEFMTIT